MAGGQFTQIANGLFRDPRISYKAKGIFGHISTHRNGWKITLAHLVAAGPDGRDAVRAGLNELERHGYLVRERLRRPNGMLGEVVYSITDHPATGDTTPPHPSRLTITSESHGLKAGIRRKPMAGGHFTQIANSLFRDSRLSFKAKGIFGYVSTHQDGWHITTAELVCRGREGAGALTTGLHQLELHGFLHRTRDRNADGTLGRALYLITDQPDPQNPAHNQSRDLQDWLSPRRLIPALRTPRERRPPSRTPDPSVPAAPTPGAHLYGQTSQAHRRSRGPCPQRTRCIRGSSCCSNSERLAPNCC
ncbi:hypothetical protein [Streptomyces sp. NPDC094022]